MEPDRARGVRQRVGARQPVQQRLPPRGRATRCASSRGRCGPVRERRRASNRRVSGPHGSGVCWLNSREFSSEIDFRETNFRVVNSPRMLHRAGSPCASMYRRCIDDVKIRFQPFARDGWARALGRGGEMMGAGVGVALFSRVNCVDGSDRGDPSFLIWRVATRRIRVVMGLRFCRSI